MFVFLFTLPLQSLDVTVIYLDRTSLRHPFFLETRQIVLPRVFGFSGKLRCLNFRTKQNNDRYFFFLFEQKHTSRDILRCKHFRHFTKPEAANWVILTKLGPNGTCSAAPRGDTVVKKM